MFNQRKVAHIAAFFLLKTAERRMSHLKLMKLLYLAERESIKQFGYAMIGDGLVSMPHGPVLSQTLDLMNGYVETHPNGWDDYIAAKENHALALQPTQNTLTLDALDELSPAECEVLEQIWQQFGHMTQWQIRDWTHEHCPEWHDPYGSSAPITVHDLVIALGFAPDVATILVTQLENDHAIDQLLATM